MSAVRSSEPTVDAPAPPAAPDDVSWLRLDSRVVWVDALRFVVSLIPMFIAWVVFDQKPSSGSVGMWPVTIFAVVGVLGSIRDVLRWLKSRYRITDERIELRVGFLTRKYRYIPRDRVRSVDLSAKLRHRIASLRVVHIGSGESKPTLSLDALSTERARELQQELVGVRRRTTTPVVEDTPAEPADQETPPEPAAVDPPPRKKKGPGQHPDEEVIANGRRSWIWYNLFSIWAFLMAAVFVWVATFLLQMVNINLREVLSGLIDWKALGLWWTIVIVLAVAYPIGVIGMAIGFITENWKFQLVRTPTDTGTALVTRHGMVETREVYRDEARIRGVTIGQPLLWRWLGITETQVVATGLSQNSFKAEAGATILPRVTIGEARRVVARVLPGDPPPLEAALTPHPRGALVRRLLMAVVEPLVLAGFLAWLGARGAIPDWVWMVPAAFLPLALVLAVVAYRSLGHALTGPYVVLRAGASRQVTTVLERRAVIGWTMSESLLQRALGLVKLTISTAAGEKKYELLDVAVDEAVAFVDAANPGLISDFVDRPVAEDESAA